MTYRYWNWTGIAVFAFMGVIACNNGSSTSANGIALVPNGFDTSCPAGSVLTYAYGTPMCQGPNGVTTPLYQNVMGGLTYGTDNYCYRNLTVSNSSILKTFLKEAMGVCDQAQSTGGLADCQAWANGYLKMDIMSNGSQLNFSLYAYPYQSSYYNYSYSMPSFSEFFLGMLGFPVYTQNFSAFRNPLTLGMTVYPINNSLGFEGRTWGDTYTVANRSLIQLQVAQGKAGDPYFTFTLSYSPATTGVSTPFLSGTLVNKAVYVPSYYGCY